MAESMTVAALQVLVPVAVAAVPLLWRQIRKVLRRLQTAKVARDSSQDSNLACIRTILDTLDRIPTLSWTEESHIQALLNQMRIKTESLNRMIENDGTLLRYLHRGKFAKNIQSVAVMMQLLETNLRLRQDTTFSQWNPNRDVNTDFDFYMASQENLIQDLRSTWRGDDFEPVQIPTRQQYEASVERSSIYPGILYEFQAEGAGASDYPRTLAISRGVRESIELLLKWLRDLKLMLRVQKTAWGSVLLGVALYESFTEILPQVLMDHLGERRSTLRPRAAQQFSKNLRFFRSFSVSSTFRTIQGPLGLQLEEDIVLHVNLRQSEWVKWEEVQRMALEVGTSSGNARRTALGHEEQECPLCGLYIAGHALGSELERHWEACFREETRLNSNFFRQNCCPVCHEGMDQLSKKQRDLHVNDCLDGTRVARGYPHVETWIL